MPKVFEYTKINTFFSSVALYHYCEFMYKLSYQLKKEKDLNYEDFQITHSYAYGIAMIICLAEFCARQYIIGQYNG